MITAILIISVANLLLNSFAANTTTPHEKSVRAMVEEAEQEKEAA